MIAKNPSFLDSLLTQAIFSQEARALVPHLKILESEQKSKSSNPVVSAVLAASLKVPATSARSVKKTLLGKTTTFVGIKLSVGGYSVTFSRALGSNDWLYKVQGKHSGMPYLQPIEKLKLSASARKSLEHVLNQKVLEYKRDVLQLYGKHTA